MLRPRRWTSRVVLALLVIGRGLSGARAGPGDSAGQGEPVPPNAGAQPGAPRAVFEDLPPLSSILSDDPETLFRHDLERFWLSGSWNYIWQGHPGFHSPYEGPQSIAGHHEWKPTSIATVFFGARVFRWTEAILDGEVAAGSGISSVAGAAAYTDIDVVRNPQLGSDPYVARAEIHQIVPLSDALVENRLYGPLSITPRLPEHRLELRAGKLDPLDDLDLNAVLSDSRFQFMNWAVVNNGAYDFAVDTRDYNYGVHVAYVGPLLAARFTEDLEPKVTNGIDLDWRVSKNHSENAELEVHGTPLEDRYGAIRLLCYANHARMGCYREALARFHAGLDPAPDLAETRRDGAVKVGVGLNAEQEITDWLRVAARVGWCDPRNESYTYTEIESTVCAGFDVRGSLWGRDRDKLGVAFETSGLGRAHRQFLEEGGSGFVLGDGTLRYGRESVVEAYYTFKWAYGLSFGPDFQLIANPGMNRDRGPIAVLAFRLHLEL